MLGTPPAFVLSQDQTLNILYLKQLPSPKTIIEQLNLSFTQIVPSAVSFLLSSDPPAFAGLSTANPSLSTVGVPFLGAFFRLHCLIYKVHRRRKLRSAPSASAANIRSASLLLLFLASPLRWASLGVTGGCKLFGGTLRITYTEPDVNTFLQIPALFSYRIHERPAATDAVLIYQTPGRLSRANL